MVRLPDNMPSNFQVSYRPVAEAGTLVQKMNLAKLLATQLSEAEMKKFPSNSIKQEDFNKKNRNEEEMIIDSEASSLKNNPAEPYLVDRDSDDKKRDLFLRSNFSSTVRTSKTYKLADVTTFMNRKTIDNLLNNTFNRILNVEGIFKEKKKVLLF
jgi:hypothetical protein